jgi:hypothetical protein
MVADAEEVEVLVVACRAGPITCRKPRGPEGD